MLALRTFLQYVNSAQLFSEADRILLAVSGGKDSVAMAHLFALAGFNFGIAHCNFQLRADESTRDEQFVYQLAQQLQVPFWVKHFDTHSYAVEHGVSIQMAARDLRYAWFKELAEQENFAFVALAQHQNDAVETLLTNLTRGTGIAGLHGILPKRAIFIRPMLGFQASEIEALVLAQNWAYVEDSSNSQLKYSRNKIRHQVVPVLKELNPNLEQTIMANMAGFWELEQFLSHQVEQLRESFFRSSDSALCEFSKSAALALFPTHLLLFELLKPYGFLAHQIQDLIQVLQVGDTGKRIYSNSHTLFIDREVVFLTLGTSLPVASAIEVIPAPGIVKLPMGELHIWEEEVNGLDLGKQAGRIVVDAAQLKWPLACRFYKQGDRFKPLGMQGSKKLSDFFVDLKIPRHQKGNIPLVVDGEDRIVWVIPFRMDNRYKVDASTKKVVIFEWKFYHGK